MEASAKNNVLIIERSRPTVVLPEYETPEGSILLSSLEKMSPLMIRSIYCFNRSDANVVDVIKQALAKVLVHYYPLAGRLAKNSRGKLFVDCQKNLGVPLVEAMTNSEIENLGDSRLLNSDVLGKLVYRDPMEDVLEVAPLLTAQVTKFRCGGFTLGIAISHYIADGVSAMNFMNAWAEIARGKPLSLVPCHDRTILKSRVPPQITGPCDEFVQISDVSNMTALYEEQQFVYKSFWVDVEKLATLKRMATKDEQVMRCTTFEALAAFVWRARSMALKMRLHQQLKLHLAVNFRSRLTTPLPGGYFGNTMVFPCCLCTMGELMEEPISTSVTRIKKAIESVTDNYAQSRIDYYDINHFERLPVGKLLPISSWMRLEYGSTDFGWGEPRFGSGEPPRETCWFMRDGKEKGIAVVLGLPLSATDTFEKLVCDLNDS